MDELKSQRDRQEALGGRLRLLERDGLSPNQRNIYDYLIETKVSWAESSDFQARLADGRLIGPFNGFLYRPEISRGFNDWVDVEAAHSSLSPAVRQVIILTVGSCWNAAYEVYAHTAVARTAGLKDSVIASIKAGQAPADASGEESAAYVFTQALVREHTVDHSAYQRSVDVFGVKGVVDMVHLIGMYLTTSALLNAFCIPAPGPAQENP